MDFQLEKCIVSIENSHEIFSMKNVIRLCLITAILKKKTDTSDINFWSIYVADNNKWLQKILEGNTN